MENLDGQKGQVLLIVVLIMVIALTVGLSLVSRSVINLKNTNEEASSQKAFQAAEAGVEIGLQKARTAQDITIGQKTLTGGASIKQVTIHPFAGSSIILNNGNPIAQDEGVDVWLTNYPDYSGTPFRGTLSIYWGSKTGCLDAAMEAIIIQGTSATDPNATIDRYGFDPCGIDSIDKTQSRTSNNHLSPAYVGGVINNQQFNFSASVAINNGLTVRLIPLYANTPIAIVGYDQNNQPFALPPQGRLITSTGDFGTTERQVSFFQGFPLLPSEFYYSVFQK